MPNEREHVGKLIKLQISPTPYLSQTGKNPPAADKAAAGPLTQGQRRSGTNSEDVVRNGICPQRWTTRNRDKKLIMRRAFAPLRHMIDQLLHILSPSCEWFAEVL